LHSAATAPANTLASFYAVADVVSPAKEQSQTAAANTSGNENLSTGATPAISQADELLFAAFAIDVNGASLTQTTGFLNLTTESAGNQITLQPAFLMVDALPLIGYADTAAINNKNGHWAFDVVTYKRKVPTVTSIVKASADPACGSSVSYTVTFRESVTAVDKNDFALAAGSVADATIDTVTGSDGVYTVTVNTGTGSGGIGLNLVDNDSIKDNDGAPIGGTGTGNGSVTGPVYTVTRDPLTITCPNPGPTANTAPGQCSAAVAYAASASGGCGSSSISYVLTGATTGSGAGTGTGLTFNKGVTTVTLTATDSLAATAACPLTITVTDTQPPSIPRYPN